MTARKPPETIRDCREGDVVRPISPSGHRGLPSRVVRRTAFGGAALRLWDEATNTEYGDEVYVQDHVRVELVRMARTS